MLQALCAVAKKPVRCLRGHGDPVRIKRLANRPIEVLSATLLDKRGYVKSSELEASDLAFLAPELTSEAEGPVRAPARADGRWGYRFVKRAFDIAFSLVAIAVLLIPSIVLCAAIRLESPGNPLYSQKRVGRIGRDGQIRTFDMYKLDRKSTRLNSSH